MGNRFVLKFEQKLQSEMKHLPAGCDPSVEMAVVNFRPHIIIFML
jgi:hypothetical protein